MVNVKLVKVSFTDTTGSKMSVRINRNSLGLLVKTIRSMGAKNITTRRM